MARWSLVTLLRHEGRFDEARQRFRDGLAEHPEPVDGLEGSLQARRRRLSDRRRPTRLRRGAPTRPGRRPRLARPGPSGRQDRPFRRGPALARPLRRSASGRSGRLAGSARMGSGSPGSPRRPPRPPPTCPSAPMRSGRRLELRAWLAGRAGDRAVERAALEAWNRADPGNTEVIDRLAAIAAESGRTDAVARFRADREAIERARSAYVALLKADDPLAHADQLAARANRLGRRFDGRAWAAIATGGDALARLRERAVDSRGTPRRSDPRTRVGGRPVGLVASEHVAERIVPRFRDDCVGRWGSTSVTIAATSPAA